MTWQLASVLFVTLTAIVVINCDVKMINNKNVNKNNNINNNNKNGQQQQTQQAAGQNDEIDGEQVMQAIADRVCVDKINKTMSQKAKKCEDDIGKTSGGQTIYKILKKCIETKSKMATKNKPLICYWNDEKVGNCTDTEIAKLNAEAQNQESLTAGVYIECMVNKTLFNY